MQAAGRVARNMTILYVKMFLSVGLTLYTTRLMRAALGDSDYGIYGLVAGFVVMLAFINTSMAAVTQRFMSYADGAGDMEAKKRVFNAGFVLHTAVALIVGVTLELLSVWFFGGTLDVPSERVYAARLLYHFTVLTTMLSIMQVPYDAVLNAHENMLVYSVVGMIESVLKLAAVALLFALPGDRLVNYGASIVAVTVVVLSLYRIYCHRRYEECEIAPRRYYDRRLMREMTSFSGWTVLTTGSSAAANHGLGLVLNSFFGSLINAAVGYANQISVQLLGFSTTMLKALNPVIAKSEGGGNRALMLKAVFTGSKAAFYLVSVLAVPFLIETPYIMTLWLGRDLPDWTIVMTRLLLVKNMIEAYSYPLNGAIAAQGDVKWVNIFRSAILLLCLPACILLFAAGYDPWMAYAVLIAGSVLGTVVLLRYARRNCGMDTADYARRVIGGTLCICAAAAAAAMVPYLAMGEGFVRVVLVAAVSLAAHALLIYRLGLDGSEKELVRALVAKVLRMVRRNRN